MLFQTARLYCEILARSWQGATLAVARPKPAQCLAFFTTTLDQNRRSQTVIPPFPIGRPGWRHEKLLHAPHTGSERCESCKRVTRIARFFRHRGEDPPDSSMARTIIRLSATPKSSIAWPVSVPGAPVFVHDTAGRFDPRPIGRFIGRIAAYRLAAGEQETKFEYGAGVDTRPAKRRQIE